MNKSPPLVSVIMPVFNGALFIDDAIGSILNQTLSNFELIIINDGSTDNSLDLVKSWAEKNQRIKVYDQENKGRSFTRNRGLELAASDLVAMMDADDISLPMRLAVQYDFMSNNPDVVVVSGQVTTICTKGLNLYNSIHSLQHKEIEKALLNDDGFQLCQPAAMMRKSIALDVGAYNEFFSVGEDADLFLRMALVGKLANVPDVVLKYRRHFDNSTAQDNIKTYQNSIPRINQAWQDRGLELPSDFKHWSEDKRPTVKEDLLRWGWNAFNKGEKGISRYYAKKLLFLRQYDLNVLRFFACILRGR